MNSVEYNLPIHQSPNHQITKSPNPSRSAAILAGGKSQRFGSNKALAPWFNGHVIDAVAQAAMGACQEVIIIADEPEPYSYSGLPVFPDIMSGLGPLAGLQSALRHAKAERVLLLGCDMPLLNSELLDLMWEIPTWAPVVIPVTPQGLEPLHAIYHKSLLPVVDHQINSGNLSLKSLARDIPCRIVSPADILKICPSFECLYSVNTPEDLARLKKIARRTISTSHSWKISCLASRAF
ncbi:MAG: molybdenum cofactor guanylyltransferase [Deltaproteobacteria bacterium]|nr:molybdenum cofactor guanylyltransferase [Deltaproteobacteria bacterium]MDL1962153.1 molybdenum cofactor guanylyltransferase [Deltaproteobacteria bacterium]